MEAQPAPVDVSKLKMILGNAKAVMKKVETNNYQTGHIDPRALTEDGVAELQSEGVRRPTMPSSSPVGYTEEMVRNSNLPPAIKEAMLKNPIPQLSSPNYTFSLDDVSDITEAAEKPMGYPKVPRATPKATPRATQPIKEQVSNSDYVTVSKSQLSEMVNELVNERLLEFFTKSYNKMIAEDTVKKTVNFLIKEGKIPAKKKIA